MSGFSGLQPDPSAIGRLLKAPFAVLAQPAVLFRQRAARLAVLAQESQLAPYLRLLQGLAEAQAVVAEALPPCTGLPETQLQRAHDAAMPPLDRAAMAHDPLLADTITRFFAAIEDLPMPAEAAAALADLRAADADTRQVMLGNVLADAIPFDALPQHLFLSAAVQIHAARLAETLDAARLVPVEQRLCPACGGPPAVSLVVERPGAEGARYACCSFCGTQWNVVRITCLACGTTKGVGYKQAEDAGSDGGKPDDATIKAETCDSCRSWVKILYQNRNPVLEPLADDVASLGLDLLMQETEYRRAGFNPFLIGY